MCLFDVFLSWLGVFWCCFCSLFLHQFDTLGLDFLGDFAMLDNTPLPAGMSFEDFERDACRRSSLDAGEALAHLQVPSH